MTERRRRILPIIMLGIIVSLTLHCNDQQIIEENTMNISEQHNIKIVIGNTILFATLQHNPTTVDFTSLLPLELKLEDYGVRRK